MPHLSNCEHHDTGWCIGCVSELWEEYYGLRTKLCQLHDQWKAEAKALENEADSLGAHEWPRNEGPRNDCYVRSEKLVSCAVELERLLNPPNAEVSHSRPTATP